jgi:hypothetical protein
MSLNLYVCTKGAQAPLTFDTNLSRAIFSMRPARIRTAHAAFRRGLRYQYEGIN